MADIIHEIRERRILPAIGVYVGGCWVLIEILDRLVERYLLSPYFTDIAFWGLYSLIPAVILIAWTHGRPGKDKATRAEKVGVPINVIATIGLLVTAFGGKDLGATANLVMVANEEGVEESHYVPTESYRRRMAVFFFENESGDPELDWLQYGVTELLVQDLQQNPFVLATSPWANFSNGFYARMKQAGFEDALGVPRSLMREIASDANRPYFIEGSFDRRADQFEITARVWETQTLKQVTELTETGFDLYGMMDSLSVGVREALDVPQVSGRVAEDLPLVETYGESTEAFRSYIRGLNARLFRNDFDASNRHFDEALEADEHFVLAWFVKALNLFEAGDLPSSLAAIRKAQELDYRLPSSDRVTLKALNYRLSGEQEKLIAFLRMQVSLRDDATSHVRLAGMLTATGQIEEAKERYLQALEKDPLNLGIYLQLSILERATGNPERAIEFAEKYRAEKPEDIDAVLVLGDYLRDDGQLDGAEEQYLQASLLDAEAVAPLLRLGDIALRKGDVQGARRFLEQAEEVATDPLHQGLVRQAVSLLQFRLGRLRASNEQLRRQEEYFSQSLSPFQVAAVTFAPMITNLAMLGEFEAANDALRIASEMVQPPLDKFLSLYEAEVLIEMGDTDGARQALAVGEELIEQFRIEDLKLQTRMLMGMILAAEGDHAGSAAAYGEALERLEKSVAGGNDVFLVLPTLLSRRAEAQLRAGDHKAAEQSLSRGFAVDPNHPLLWVARARLQLDDGMTELANASVNYALAIWKDADPDYRELMRAQELQAEIERTL